MNGLIEAESVLRHSRASPLPQRLRNACECGVAREKTEAAADNSDTGGYIFPAH
jgi:hypothetical protein